jgi:hypothetical protein
MNSIANQEIMAGVNEKNNLNPKETKFFDGVTVIEPDDWCTEG